MSKKAGAKKLKMSSSSKMRQRRTDPDDSDSSGEGMKANRAFRRAIRESREEAEREQQRQAGNVSPLADEGEGHTRREGDAGDDDGSGDDDRHTSPPSPPPKSPPPISPPPPLDPPPISMNTSTLNTTNIKQTMVQQVNAASIRQLKNEQQQLRSAGLTVPPSTQIGQSALAAIASIFATSQGAGIWPAGEEPRLLFPNIVLEDNEKICTLIDSNPIEFFRILSERYPEEANVSTCFTQACCTFPPEGVPKNSELDQWVNLTSTFLLNGQLTPEQQRQVISCHRAHSNKGTSLHARRMHGKIHPSENVDRHSQRPLGAYMQRVVTTLSEVIETVRHMEQLGFTVAVTGAQKPASTDKVSGKEGKRDRQGNPKNPKPNPNPKTPQDRCVFCGNDPKVQAKVNIKPTCDLKAKTCVNEGHPDCNKAGAKPFEESEIGKKYASAGKKRFIIKDWQWDETSKTLVKKVIDLELHELEHDQSLTTNTEMLFPSVQHISERQREKPCVMLRLEN